MEKADDMYGLDPSIQYTDGPDGTKLYTDADGFEYSVQKKWHYHNSLKFASEEVAAAFEIADGGGNTAITPAMQAYTPGEIILQYGKNPAQRLVVAPKSRWTAEENQHMLEFKEWCKAKGVRVPDDDIETFRFFQAKKWDIKGTYDMLVEKGRLKTETLPMMINEKTLDIMRKGFFYIAGRDRCLRTIVVCNPSVIFTMKPVPTGNEVIASLMATTAYNQSYMLQDGVIENVLIVINMQGLGIFNMNYGLMKEILAYMVKVMKGRARSIFILNAPSTFSAIWKVATYFIDETTARKVQVSSYAKNDELIQLCHPEQLEEKFGGSAANRSEGDFWPPRLPSTEFGVGVELKAPESTVDYAEPKQTEEEVEKEFKDAQAKE